MVMRSLDALRIRQYRARRRVVRRARAVRAWYREQDERQARLPWAWRQLTAPARMLPSFLVVGAQKGGTTALHQYLTEHPDVLAARAKELQYLTVTTHPSRRGYRAHFPMALWSLARRLRGRPPLLTFEATPNYLPSEAVPGRVVHVLGPQVRCIVLLREPVERAVSQVRMGQRKGWERLPLREALAAEAQRWGDPPSRYGLSEDAPERWGQYAAWGCYADQLERWFALLPRQQFLVLRSEDLRDHTQATYDRVCDFVGLARHRLRDSSPRHMGDGSGVPADARALLAPHFEAPNRRLVALTGIHWNGPQGPTNPPRITVPTNDPATGSKPTTRAPDPARPGRR